MCGIVGYIGDQQAAPILLAGLAKLEYRGYDSAGISVRNETNGEIEVVKARHFSLRNNADAHLSQMAHRVLPSGYDRYHSCHIPNDPHPSFLSVFSDVLLLFERKI